MSQSPSFIRTDNAIMYAFISLLKEKSFEKITVQDILERTPVTRGTFYAHYHDKYEIAERMLEKYLENRSRVRAEVHRHASVNSPTLRASSEINHDMINALLKIHTEKVDLRRAIESEFEKEYLETASSPTATIEARIFAQARAALEFAIYDDSVILTFKNTKDIIENVADSLLRTVEKAQE